MKKIIALFLVFSLLLTACTQQNEVSEVYSPVVTESGAVENRETIPDLETISTDDNSDSDTLLYNEDDTYSDIIEAPVFTNLSDVALHQYIEDAVFADIINLIDSDYFFIENIEAIYLSNEYLEELAFNSKENEYFGYKLSELNDFFQGTRYIFTLGEDGGTTVQPFEEYDDTFDRIVRNVAIGTGVILLSVTMAVIAPAVGAPAAFTSLFAIKNVTGTALIGAGLSGGIAGVVTGVTTGDINEALTTAALAGSEGFMWGAISAPVINGISAATAARTTPSILIASKALSPQQKNALRSQAVRIVDATDGVVRTGKEVHHVIPLSLRHRMGQNFNPNAKSNLALVDQNIHQQITARWNEFSRINPNPSQRQILNMADEINSLFGNFLTFIP
jgi:hypothetical protein